MKKFLAIFGTIMLMAASAFSADSLFIRNTGWPMASSVRLQLEHVISSTSFTNTTIAVKANCTSWDTTLVLPDYRGMYKAVFMIQYSPLDPYLPYELPFYATFNADSTLTRLINSIAIYTGGCDSCSQVLYPLDGSPIKDSVLIKNGSGVIIGRIKFVHNTDPSVIDSIIYNRR